MRAVKQSLIAALALAGQVQAAGLFKCQGANGPVTFQSSPCHPAEQATEVTVRDSHLVKPEPEKARKFWVGMTADQLYENWGYPARRNLYGGAGGSTEQWIYEYNGGTEYFYVENGRVRSYDMPAHALEQ